MFDDGKLYLAGDPALAVIASYSTMAHWRVGGSGPPYLKLGQRVAYRGADLNEWLASCTVRPTDSRRGAA